MRRSVPPFAEAVLVKSALGFIRIFGLIGRAFRHRMGALRFSTAIDGTCRMKIPSRFLARVIADDARSLDALAPREGARCLTAD